MTRLRFDPAAYPGWRPDGPTLVHRGTCHRVVVDGDRDQPVRAPVHAPVLEPGRTRWSLAYGGNACPDRLIDKGLDGSGALLLPAVLSGWQPVFESRATRYGSVPLTLVPAPGQTLGAWVLGVHEDDVPALDRSEGRYLDPDDPPRVRAAPGSHDAVTAPVGAYVLGRVGPAAVADRFLLPDTLAYLPGPATTLAADADGAPLAWPACDQAAARAATDQRRRARLPTFQIRPVPPGLWPATPLEDLPLFVYGTLLPSQDRWHLVADLVADTRPATATGWLHDPGHGWPAARFDPAGGTVHGQLLLPAGAQAAQDLYARCDRIEGAPHLFVRVTVQVATDDDQRWAATYAWAGAGPIGRRITSGSWPPA